MKKKEGVKISSLPPSHKSIAVAFNNAETRVEPNGAIRNNSKTHTIVCVHIRPLCVMRNPDIDILPFKVSYHGISLELCTPLLAS